MRRQTCFVPRPPSNLVAPLMQTCGYPSLSLRFSSDFLVNTKCKAVFAVARFVIHLLSSLSLHGVLTLVNYPIMGMIICSCITSTAQSREHDTAVVAV